MCELGGCYMKCPHCGSERIELGVAWGKSAVVRGQLSANFRKEEEKEDLQEWLVHHLLTNVLARPDFIAYSHKSSGNLSRNLCRMFGATAVAWTIRSQEELNRNKKKFDLFIFEGFKPE